MRFRDRDTLNLKGSLINVGGRMIRLHRGLSAKHQKNGQNLAGQKELKDNFCLKADEY